MISGTEFLIKIYKAFLRNPDNFRQPCQKFSFSPIKIKMEHSISNNSTKSDNPLVSY